MTKSTTEKVTPKNSNESTATDTATAIGAAGKRPDGSQKTGKTKASAKTRAATSK